MASKAKNTDGKPGEAASVSGPSFRSRLIRVVRWGCLLVLIFFALSNLWLWSAWGTSTAEAELKKRTGQDWEIGSMSWSPWNGITLYDIRMLQPEALRERLGEPVMVVEKIRVRPYWRLLARGQVYPQSVEIDSPELTVSVEMLAAIASRTVHVKAQTPLPAPSPTKPSVKKPPVTPPVDKQPVPPQKKIPEPTTPSPDAPEPRLAPPGMAVHLKITNARLCIVSAAKQIDLCDVDGLDYDHILLGEDSRGALTVRSLEIIGLPELTDLRQSIIWKRPYLELEERAIDLGGVKARWIAQLGIGKTRMGSLPFLLDFAVDPQTIKSAQWFEYVAMDADADSLIARLRVTGLLHQPDSWRADGMLAARNFTVHEHHGNRDVVFEEIYVPVVFRQGTLRWSGVRLMSEDLAVMGNGSVSLRDGHLSVTRIVASPEVAGELMRGVYGSQLSGARDRWWQDLITPDRKVLDLLVSGSLLEPNIDLGSDHADVPLFPLVAEIVGFIRNEMKEEGKELKALPAPKHHQVKAPKP